MRCPSCNKKLNKEDDICFNCGYPIGLGKAHSIDTYSHNHGNVSGSNQDVHINEETSLQRVNQTSRNRTKTKQGDKRKSGVGAVLSVLGVLIFVAIRWLGNEGLDSIGPLDFESQETEVDIIEESYQNLYDEVYDDLLINQYTYEDSLGNPWIFFEIENTSDYDIYIEVYLDTYDAGGNLIDGLIMADYSLEKGTITLVPFVLEDWYEEAWFDMSIWEADYEGHTSDLVVANKKTQDGETLVIANKGDSAVFFLEARLLFFKDGNIVNYASNYFIDDDQEIKPGATIVRDYYCYEEYDEVKVYILD